MSTRVAKLAFNRGLVSRLGVARSDIQRIIFSSEIQTNWISRVLGSMSIRVGFGFQGSTLNDAACRLLRFVFSISQKAKLEITDSALRVWIDDALVTRTAVSSVVTNGTFATNLTGWTSADEAGATSQWTNGTTGGDFSFSGGFLGLTGNGTAAAIRYQQISVAMADKNVEHALRIVIANGPVILRVGSSIGADDYITETSLGKGSHSLTLTPTNDFYIQFKSTLKRQVLVDSCTVEGSGVMSVTAPWTVNNLDDIRGGEESTSGDVVFVACKDVQQQTIERRSTRSWSVVTYEPEDGPFRVANVTPITITPSALSGNVTLTASSALFKSTQVGALFRVTSNGQTVAVSVVAENQFSNAIRVTGTGDLRSFALFLTGVWVGTVTLQASFTSSTGPWVDQATWTANITRSITDGLDNQIVWYRIGIKTGDFTSGQADITLVYASGSISGVARITKYSSSTSVKAEVIADFGSTLASDNWEEGKWSTYRGFPTSVTFHDGRLGWFGKDATDLTVSDSFFSFASTVEGDSGPISRRIGSGPVDTIEWALSLQRLILGGQGAEFTAMSSSLDEPLTPTNFNLKSTSGQGSASVSGIKVDQSGVFIQRGGTRVYELSLAESLVNYQARQLSALIPEIGEPGIVRMAVQRQPDTRIHFVRSDGTAAMLIFDKVEQVECWLEIETDGNIEEVLVLPGDEGDEEDFVYYVVNRTINGSTKRYIEKWAFQSECLGDTTCKLADSFITYNQVPSSTISVPHLIGEEVVVWDNGICLSDANGDIETFTVDGSGNITVTNEGSPYLATVGMVGLPYQAPWKSSRLSEIMQSPEGNVGQQQTIDSLSLVLADIHPKGLKFGRDLETANMDDLPEIGQDGEVVDQNEVRESYTMDVTGFPGDYGKDPRLCLLAQAPRPCTVLAAVATVKHNG